MKNLIKRKKVPVAILGATGMVGQRLILLLAKHSMFNIRALIASPSSAEKTYACSVKGRWFMERKIPSNIATMKVETLPDLMKKNKDIRVVFSALNMDKKEIQKIEYMLADKGFAVISNNSAHRWTEEIPMIMPEINKEHLALIDVQRKKHGWTSGLIVVKPNCSIQSYVTILTALKDFKPVDVKVTSLQAISGAGKTFETWPEMLDNVIPYIDREEEKSEREPMRIWGTVKNGKIQEATTPHISATCIRVPATNGHMAAVSVKFKKRPTKKEILIHIKKFNKSTRLGLPLSPKELIHVFEDNSRPQTKLDRDLAQGMAISVGRIRESNAPYYDWEFISLSHNTLRGAAGGGVLTAEFLNVEGLF